MPEVIIRHSTHLPENKLRLWGDDLLTIIAEELDVPEREEGRLKREEIEIIFIPQGKLDINCLPLRVRIEAMNFPERVANKDERSKRIAERARKSRYFPEDPRLRPPGDGFIWLILSEAAFTTF